MHKEDRKYINREIGWLSFNERVLQEAADPRNPIIERIKFLGIFSSNLDEFFRVRVATIKRMVDAEVNAKALIGESPEIILDEIQEIVLTLQNKFDTTYENILRELKNNKIFIINEKELTPDQEEFVKAYFQQEVRPSLFPVMLDDLAQFPILDDHSIYLAVLLGKKEQSKAARHALIEVPTEVLSRFLVLPKKDGNRFIILLDDVIRANLKEIFSIFDFKYFDAYTIKLTRDAELDIEDDITISFLEKISKGLKKREKGVPVRFIYDSEIPESFMKVLVKKNNITSTDSLIPGGRYHNFKDFMEFPSLGLSNLQYRPFPVLPHRDINARTSMFNIIRKKDILFHYPYQSFNHFIDLLREASIDPKVVSIKISLYRLAKNSNVVNALINAARNGKAVTVVMELQARFDEKANIYWTDMLREEGVKILYGVPDLKVHAKLLLITRKEKGSLFNYVNASTGNYNEETARLYCDLSFFTADKKITGEVEKIFEFFEKNYKTGRYEHLLVSPFYMRNSLVRLIKVEIDNARSGKEAYIILKVNNLVDQRMTDKLYEASKAGVKISLIVRGACSLVPGVPGWSENIQGVSIVDKLLEHSRIFVFANGGQEKIYLSSGDWMTRNLDGRVEIACPIYDPGIKRELMDYLNIQLRDNTKAREMKGAQDNRYKRSPGKRLVRSQLDFFKYLQKKNIKTIKEHNEG